MLRSYPPRERRDQLRSTHVEVHTSLVTRNHLWILTEHRSNTNLHLGEIDLHQQLARLGLNTGPKHQRFLGALRPRGVVHIRRITAWTARTCTVEQDVRMHAP